MSQWIFQSPLNTFTISLNNSEWFQETSATLNDDYFEMTQLITWEILDWISIGYTAQNQKCICSWTFIKADEIWIEFYCQIWFKQFRFDFIDTIQFLTDTIHLNWIEI